MASLDTWGGLWELVFVPQWRCSHHDPSAGLLNGQITDPQTPSPETAVDRCCSISGDMNNMLGIYCLYVFSVFISNFFGHNGKEPCKISFVHCLNCKQLFLMLPGVAFLHVYFTENMFKQKHKTNRQLSSWVELQYGIIFSLIYAIPGFGFIF